MTRVSVLTASLTPLASARPRCGPPVTLPPLLAPWPALRGAIRCQLLLALTFSVRKELITVSPTLTVWRLLADGKTPATPDPLHPRPAQNLPGGLGTATDTLIGWSITAALIACALGFIGGFAGIAIGNNSERPELAARGKRSVLWSCVAAAGTGMVFAILKAFYGLGS